MEEDKKVSLPTSVEETDNKVYKTTDYGIFKYINANRTVVKRHVQEIIASMEDHSDWLQHRPVMVNENMEVIDGQHRIQAASTLHVPIFFTIAKNTDVTSAQLMNATQKGWSPIDFARSYALGEDQKRAKTYQKFLALLEEYNPSITTLVAFCEGKARRNNIQSFRKGELEIQDEDETRRLLDQLMDIQAVIPGRVFSHSRHALTSALLRIFDNPKYDHERMVKKLNEKQLETQIDKTGYLRALEGIYNFNMRSDDSVVRFF